MWLRVLSLRDRAKIGKPELRRDIINAVRPDSVRVMMPLTDRDAYLNLANENSDIMVKLVKGQFAIINVDTVWHGSITFDNEPRDMLNMIVKWNPWLHELTRSKPIVDIERIKL